MSRLADPTDLLPPPREPAPARIAAHFDDFEEAHTAMTEVVGPDLGRRAEIVSAPIDTRAFALRRILWGAVGAASGALIGGLATAAYVGHVVVERGRVIEGPLDGVLVGALIGAALLGSLGLLSGLAAGEPEASRAARREARRKLESEHDELPSSVFVRVELPAGASPRGPRGRAVEAVLETAGGRSIAEDSAAPSPDAAPLAARERGATG